MSKSVKTLNKKQRNFLMWVLLTHSTILETPQRSQIKNALMENRYVAGGHRQREFNQLRTKYMVDYTKHITDDTTK